MTAKGSTTDGRTDSLSSSNVHRSSPHPPPSSTAELSFYRALAGNLLLLRHSVPVPVYLMYPPFNRTPRLRVASVIRRHDTCWSCCFHSLSLAPILSPVSWCKCHSDKGKVFHKFMVINFNFKNS